MKSNLSKLGIDSTLPMLSRSVSTTGLTHLSSKHTNRSGAALAKHLMTSDEKR